MLADRRTKIVATIGPATQSKENLRKCIMSGMNVARLNFSHGEHAEHAHVITMLRELAQQTAKPLAILQDLSGPIAAYGKSVLPIRYLSHSLAAPRPSLIAHTTRL